MSSRGRGSWASAAAAAAAPGSRGRGAPLRGGGRGGFAAGPAAGRGGFTVAPGAGAGASAGAGVAAGRGARGGIRGRRGRGGYRGRGGRRFAGRGRRMRVHGGAAGAERDAEEANEFELPEFEIKSIAVPHSSSSAGVPENLGAKEMRELLLNDTARMQEHMDAIMRDPIMYANEIHTLVDRRMASSLSTPIKGRVLAASIAAKRWVEVDYLLAQTSLFGIAEMVKCVQILDAPRKVRQLEKKLSKYMAMLEKEQIRPKTVAEMKTDVHNASTEMANGENFKLSVSGACAKRLRRWVKSIPKEKLEFFLLFFPTDPWKAFADIVHLKLTDFNLPYFLPMVFGTPAPPDSLIADAQAITKENLEAILNKHPPLCFQYAYIRKKLKDESQVKAAHEAKVTEITTMGFTRHAAQVGLRHTYGVVGDAIEWIVEHGDIIAETPVIDENIMTDNAKAVLARLCPLDDVLWNWDELACLAAEKIVTERLARGETLEGAKARSSYGKLMERILYFRSRGLAFANYLVPYAEGRLKDINIPRVDDLKVAVFGDASGSMEVAIKCSATLGSLLSVALNASLSFFNTQPFAPSCIPRTVEQVLQVVEETRAEGGTSMACALWPYYEQRRALDLIVLVSDEGENETCHDLMFSPLLKKYMDEVAPRVKVVLISFVSVGQQGQLYEAIQREGLTCRQVRLDGRRPDTSKFDSVLGLVTLETTELRERRDAISETLTRCGVSKDPINLILEY